MLARSGRPDFFMRMTTLLLFVLCAFANANPAGDQTFVTGYRGRPVRITATNLDSLPGVSISHVRLVRFGIEHVRQLNAAIDACTDRNVPCDLHILTGNWFELFSLGVVMKLATRPEWSQNLDRLQLLSIPSLVEDVYADAAADPVTANAIARRMTQPFRENWLYSSTDAAALDRIEDWFRRGWVKNQMVDPLNDFLSYPALSFEPFRIEIPTLFRVMSNDEHAECGPSLLGDPD